MAREANRRPADAHPERLLWAVWGVYDYVALLDDTEARRLLESWARTVRRKVRASTAACGRVRAFRDTTPMLASPFYHGLHISQLSITPRLLDMRSWFAGAERWREYGRSGALSGYAPLYKRRRSSALLLRMFRCTSLLIHQAFAAPTNPGGTRHYELASGLVARGHHVTRHHDRRHVHDGPGARRRGVAPRWAPRSSAWSRTRDLQPQLPRAGHRALRLCRSRVARGTPGRGGGCRLGHLAPARPGAPGVPGHPSMLARHSYSRSGTCGRNSRSAWGSCGTARSRRSRCASKRLMYSRARAVLINSPGFAPFLANTAYRWRRFTSSRTV